MKLFPAQLVLGGENRKREGDFEILGHTAEQGASTPWACGKYTKAGQILLLYFKQPHSGIIATAMAVTSAKKGEIWPYEAMIGDIKFLPCKISIAEVKELLPAWPWHKYPRSHTYLDQQKANILLERAGLNVKTPPARVTVSGGGFGTPEENRLVERAACEAVEKYYTDRKYSVKSREREKIGYDFDVTRDKRIFHVEVKGVSGTLLRFPITANEVKCAEDDPLFRLAVVTSARTDPKIQIFTPERFRQRFKLTPLAYYAEIDYVQPRA